MPDKDRKLVEAQNKKSATGQSLRQALIYLALGCAWILVTDHFMLLFSIDSDMLALVSAVKGIVYVLATAVIFFFLMYRAIRKILKSNSEIAYLAFYDELTGLRNRKYVDELLRGIDADGQLPLSVIIGDFNGLKLVNDAFGHAFGDALLKLAASALKNTCREQDIVSRWGNGEFLILLPRTDAREAEALVGRLKDACAKAEHQSIFVDITFGCSTKAQAGELLTDVINKAENLMYDHKIVDTKSMRSKTIKIIMSTLHEKNPREAAHSSRVGELSRLISEAAGFSNGDAVMMGTIGFLHDIGKIAIGEEVLNKTGKLTETEVALIRQHPEIGCRILLSSYGVSDMTEAVLCHHERWDGQGYPRGLAGEAIPRISRIIAIADSYDAMTSERPYKNKMTAEEAREEIRRNAGYQFDPDIAALFIEKVFPHIGK
jgi:diguanylate cyclase (GGDEF)-like protein